MEQNVQLKKKLNTLLMNKRIIMKRLLMLVVISSFLVSCKDKEKDKLYDELIAGYQRENAAVKSMNHRVYWSLNDKIRKQETMDVALEWEPKARVIFNNTDTLINYLDSCINNITQDSTKNDLNKDYNNNFSSGLYKRLLNYKTICFKLDPELKSNFKNNLFLTATTKDTIEQPLKIFMETGIKDKKQAVAFLAGIENKVLSMEFALIDFCDKKTAYTDDFYFSFCAIAAQNTDHLKAGEKLHITAGEGCFSKKRKNRIFINNRQIKLNAEGIAEYEIKAPDKPGKYHIPVKIEYSKQDSTKGFVDKDIVYTVDE